MKFTRRRTVILLAVALTVILGSSVFVTLATANTTNLLTNGDFEDGFQMVNGCGAVGMNWNCFTTGGKGGYGFYDDAWPPVVATGSHAQLIEINTKKDFGDQNRTAGIYQTVDVEAGQTYTLTFKALMRANDLGSAGDPWRYVMLVGFTHDGNADWANASVQEVNVGPIQDRVNPSGYYDVVVPVKAQGNKLTIFIAGRMKWGDWNREVDFDIDSISLNSPPAKKKVTPATKESKAPTPEPVLICDGPNLLANGGFEEGFDTNGTAKDWSPYNNDGAANYGYYDDQWPRVVADDAHAQLLEINSRGWEPTDPERWIGVYQTIEGEKTDPTYQLTLKAMIRESADHHGEDPWRYEVYWGLNIGNETITNVSDLEVLTGIPVSDIYLRTNPGDYVTYTTRFDASGETMQLYLLGLKKWATPEREVNFDFDSVVLQRCHEKSQNPPDPPAEAVNDPAPQVSTAPQTCSYIIQHGDYLGLIAKRYHSSIAWLTQANHISNPSRIYAGQSLKVPCAMQTASAPAPSGDAINGSKAANKATATSSKTASKKKPAAKKKPKAKIRIHVVKRGENLSLIAYRYHTTVATLRQLNHIKNPRLIRPGQKIKLPTS